MPLQPAPPSPAPCPAFLTLYANGKSAVRVDAPGVRHLGPHFFVGDASPRWGGLQLRAGQGVAGQGRGGT